MADVQADSHPGQHSARPAIVIAALGVVFGDIGTSPIYTLQTVFNPGDPHPVPISRVHIFGIVSLIFWSVMIIVSLTYVTLVMRADNNGEGGIMALITLLRRSSSPRGRRTAAILAALGIFGAALFFGDSMITPAISVLSAVEGLKIIEPSLDSWIVPITAVIIVALFSVQRQGSAIVGRFFGPVMVAWFVTIAACGIRGVLTHPQILWALSPTYALSFMVGNFHIAFFALAAVVLAVTGAEALYADMGHFGRRAITRGWLLVLPACTLSYLGQGALLIGDERLVNAPFFLLVPEWGRIPIVLLATAATVIASQAVVTGAFSVASQAAQLGYLPRLRIAHTSASTIGQIYVPWINGLLMISVLTLVFAFRSSAALGYAYGMAVTATITITTLLFFYLARTRWHTPLWLVLLGAGALLTVDLLFFAGRRDQAGHARVAATAHRDRRLHRWCDRHQQRAEADRHLRARARSEAAPRSSPAERRTRRWPASRARYTLDRGRDRPWRIRTISRACARPARARHRSCTLGARPVPRVPWFRTVSVRRSGLASLVAHLPRRRPTSLHREAQMSLPRCAWWIPPTPKARSRSTRRPTSWSSSTWLPATRRPWRRGVRGC